MGHGRVSTPFAFSGSKLFTDPSSRGSFAKILFSIFFISCMWSSMKCGIYEKMVDSEEEEEEEP